MGYVVRSQVKGYFKRDKLRLSGEFLEALDLRIEILLSEVSERARGNKRGTVMKHDL